MKRKFRFAAKLFVPAAAVLLFFAGEDFDTQPAPHAGRTPRFSLAEVRAWYARDAVRMTRSGAALAHPAELFRTGPLAPDWTRGRSLRKTGGSDCSEPPVSCEYYRRS